MSQETFKVGSDKYKIDITPAPTDGEKYPILLLLHGNFGMIAPYATPILDFALELGGDHYVVGVPHYYADDGFNLADTDMASKQPILSAAITYLSARPDADPDRIGLVGFSLGGGIAMTYIVAQTKPTIGVFADFFGLTSSQILSNAGFFPPTILFHNDNDMVVPMKTNSTLLDGALGTAKVPHAFYHYDKDFYLGVNHAFQPGGFADTDSRSKTHSWFKTYSPATGK
jgi:carboxymethylenebutenolidase